MFKDLLLRKLEHTQKATSQNKLTKKTMIKIQKQKRLSSKEFLEVQETIWQPGPRINYKNADNWKRVS
jgi:hypothetical protein